MKIHLLAVGDKMPGWVDTGLADYLKRLQAPFSFQLLTVPLAKRGKTGDPATYQKKEGEALLAKLPSRCTVIVLDVAGQQISTEQLASKLEQWQQTTKQLCFIIGGPDGLSEAVRSRADWTWSLSALTLPHPLVRLVTTEQIYRAWSFTQGHPYHRE